jgi:hypothetical protein
MALLYCAISLGMALSALLSPRPPQAVVALNEHSKAISGAPLAGVMPLAHDKTSVGPASAPSGPPAATSNPLRAAIRPDTFGPGKVSCQRLGVGEFDCLLTSLRISANGNNVATFGLAALPVRDRAGFQKWCSTAADDCTVEIDGVRQSVGSSRFSTVTAVRWTRLRPPRNQAAATTSADGR